jgi:hypothetical protein
VGSVGDWSPRNVKIAITRAMPPMIVAAFVHRPSGILVTTYPHQAQLESNLASRWFKGGEQPSPR